MADMGWKADEPRYTLEAWRRLHYPEGQTQLSLACFERRRAFGLAARRRLSMRCW